MDNDDLENVGSRLRAARRAHGLTLDRLAREVGMSVSTLSRLESGKRQASLELVVPLARRLGIGLDDLVSARRPPDPRVRRAVLRRGGLLIAPLTAEHSQVSAYRITYPSGAALPELRVHDGFEWLYVLRGRLRLRLGEQDLTLSRGEAAEFDTHTPHAMSATGGHPAEVLSIFNEAGVRIHTHTEGDAQ